MLSKRMNSEMNHLRKNYREFKRVLRFREFYRAYTNEKEAVGTKEPVETKEPAETKEPLATTSV